MWKWSYDSYYVDMEKEFNKYKGYDCETEEVISRHFRKNE